MSNDIFKYPLDLHGTAVTNRVVNELHEIGNRTQRVFASDYGPFFGNTVVVRDAVTNRVLIPVSEYLLLHAYEEAQDRVGQAVYAAVLILNPEVSTRVHLDCNYVGGEFSYSKFALVQAIDALVNTDQPVYWGELVGVPSQFAPAPHLHSIYHTYGWKTMVDAVNEVGVAIREAGVANQQLLFQQLNQKFTEIDDFMNALAEEYRKAADELALL